MDLEFLIPIVALCIPIVAIWARHKQKMAQLEITRAQTALPDAHQYEATIADLEKRIRVLERIATQASTSHDIASQIEALRDLDDHSAPTYQEVNAR